MFKIEAQPDLILDEDSLLGLNTALFLLCHHMAFPLSVRGGRERETVREREKNS